MVTDESTDVLLAAVADQAEIDWDTQTGADPELVRSLRIISEIGAKQREVSRLNGLPGFLITGYLAVVGLACVKVVLAMVGVVTRVSSQTDLPSDWPLIFLMLLFGISGPILIIGATRDRRLLWLGALFVTIASAFCGTLIPAGSGDAVDAVTSVIRVLYSDAFLALGLWMFAWYFPSEPTHAIARRLGLAFLLAAAGAGMALFAASAAANLPSLSLSWNGPIPRLPGAAEAALYWPLLFGIAAPAIPFLIWKSRNETLENRRRIHFFLTLLAVAFCPMVLAAIVAPLVPALQEDPWRGRVGLLLYGSLALVVPGTAYSVAVGRVMDLSLVVRRTMQYAFARSTVQAASLVPLLLLFADLYRHRGLTVRDYMNQLGPNILLGLSAIGALALACRHEILRAVDRWFLRGTTDHAEAIAGFERESRTTHGVRDLSGVLVSHLRHAVHPTSVGVLVTDESRGALVSLGGGVPPLRRGSILFDLFRSVRTEVQIGYRAHSPLAELLPEADRHWLASTGFQLFFPLVGSDRSLLGLVGLGKCLNGLPYTERDCMLVTAMCNHAGLKLENDWLREHSPLDEPNRRQSLSPIDWDNEPATRCEECRTLWGPADRVCACGSPTVEAALPLVVKGKFRVERFLGAGGTGVVYQAVDMALDRRVAIKTLPAVHLRHAPRLIREARAMANVQHPNLALIYGAETWKQTPLLIFEYLEGGTLAHSLRSGPLALDEVLGLGTLLADALDRVHASAVLHRDVKPSNIGYTSDGIPKLLDFGLAAILDGSMGAAASGSAMPTDRRLLEETVWNVAPTSSLTVTHQLVGTPLYLSPEAVAGHPPEASFDLWSLSLMLYEAYAGRHPLAGLSTRDVLEAIRQGAIPEIRTIRPDCPRVLAELLADALCPAPARRPATAADLRTRLRSAHGQLFPLAPAR